MAYVLLLLAAIAGATPADELARWSDRLKRPDPQGQIYEGYRFTGHIFPELADVARRKPGVVRVESIGTSHNNRPIWAFHVQAPGAAPTRRVLVFAGIHAFEWISNEVAVDRLHELIAAPPRDVAVTVVPLLNPDGRARVEADLLKGRLDRYHRSNGKGVDLNRNFAVNRDSTSFWRHVLPGYHDASGDHALSEPETRALDALVATGGYDRAASLHAYGGFFYFPWAGRWARPDDYADFVALGRAMERAQGGHAYRPRQLARWGFFFRAQGAELDHLYGEHGVKTFLVELTRSGLGPNPLKNRKVYFRWYNPANSAPHRARGVAAMRALIHADP